MSSASSRHISRRSGRSGRSSRERSSGEPSSTASTSQSATSASSASYAHTSSRSTSGSHSSSHLSQRSRSVSTEDSSTSGTRTGSTRHSAHSAIGQTRLPYTSSRSVGETVLSTHQLLRRIQGDYQKFASLSRDYRRKHKDALHMYITLSKLLLLWHQTSQGDGALNSSLMRIVQDANLMSDDELDAIRRTDRRMADQVRAATADIDREFFTPTNPLFQDLTPDQQQTILADKEARQNLFLERLQSRQLLQPSDSASAAHGLNPEQQARYQAAFATEYFRDDTNEGTLHDVWGTHALLVPELYNTSATGAEAESGTRLGHAHATQATFLQFLQTDMSVVSTEVIGDERTLSGPSGRYAATVFEWAASNLSGLRHCEYLAADLLGSTTTPTTSVQPEAYMTDIADWLQRHPAFSHDVGTRLVLLVTDWRDRADKLFRGVWQPMYVLDNSTRLRYNTAHRSTTLELHTGQSALLDPEQVVLLSSRDAQTAEVVPYIPSPHVPTEDMPHHAIEIPKRVGLSSAYGNMQLLRLSDSLQSTVLPPIAELYGRVVGTGETRYDALGQVVWAACIEDGRHYPILPTLHFVTGLHTSLLETDELAWWCSKTRMLSHMVRINTELSDPRNDELQLQRGDPAIRMLAEPTSLERREAIWAGDSADSSDSSSLGTEETDGVTPAHDMWRELLERDCRVHTAVRHLARTEPHAADSTPAADVQVALPAHCDGNVMTYCEQLFVCLTNNGRHEPSEEHLFPPNADTATTLSDQFATQDKDAVWSIFPTDLEANKPALYHALVALYLQLGKLRTCPFTDNPRLPHPEDIRADIATALHTQMRLANLAGKYTPYTAVHHRYSDIHAEYTRLRQSEPAESWLLTWETFRNVFGTALLHPWRREHDGMGCARELCQYLFLDKLDGSTLDARSRQHQRSSVSGRQLRTPAQGAGRMDTPAVRTEHVLDMVTVLRDAAYPASPSSDPQQQPPPSACHVHLLRLLLWNVGIWELELDISTRQLVRLVEHYLDQIQTDPTHLFQKRFAIEDLTHGYPSPLVLSQLFAACARFVRFNDEQRAASKREEAFLKLYDEAVVRITHPRYLATFLTFRSEFMTRPKEALLHMIWHHIDIGRWSTSTRLSSHLVEYGVAWAIGQSTFLYPEREFWAEHDTVLAMAKRVAQLSDDAVAQMHKEIRTNHMGRLLG